MSSIVKNNEENVVMKKVANAKTNKEQKKINKVSCPCAIMNLTPKKGLEYFLKGVPVFTMKKSYVNDGKETIKDILFTSCSKTCKEGSDYCFIHQKQFDNDPLKVVIFNDIKNAPGVRLIKDENDVLLNRRKGKKATPKKNRREIHKRIVENNEAYDKYNSLVDNIETQILQELNQAEYSTNIESEPKKEAPKKKASKKKVIKNQAEEIVEQANDSDEEVEVEEEVEEEVDINQSDDEEDEEDFEEFETTDGRHFLKKENLIYSVEEKSEPFAELIEVSDEDAPFNPKDNEYYIAGESIEIKSKNYIVCKISDFVYDSDSLNKLGKVKKNKSGVITGIKKA